MNQTAQSEIMGAYLGDGGPVVIPKYLGKVLLGAALVGNVLA